MLAVADRGRWPSGSGVDGRLLRPAGGSCHGRGFRRQRRNPGPRATPRPGVLASPAAGWSLRSRGGGISGGSDGGVAPVTVGWSLRAGAAGVPVVKRVSAVGGIGRCLRVGGLEGGLAVAVDYPPVVVMDVVVTSPAHEHQIVDVSSPTPGIGHDVMGLALAGIDAAADTAPVPGDEHPPLGGRGGANRGAVIQRFAVSEDDPGELGVAGDALQHLRRHRPGAGYLAAPGGVLAGEDADVGHGDDLGFGPPPRPAASLGPFGIAGGQQVQGVGPELIPRPQTLAVA